MNMSRISTVVLLVFSLFVCLTATPYAVEHDADVPVDEMLSLATSFIERRTSTLVVDNGLEPLSELAASGVREAEALFVYEQSSLDELDARRRALQVWGEAYTYSNTNLTLQHLDRSIGVVTMDVTEFTQLFYEKINGAEPDYTAWSVNRRFVFIMDVDGWELVSQELLDAYGPVPINEPTLVSEEAMLDALDVLTCETTD